MGVTSYSSAPTSMEMAALTADRLITFFYNNAESQAAYAAYGVAYAGSSGYVAQDTGVPSPPAPLSVILPPGQYFISAVAGDFQGGSDAAMTFGYTLVPVDGATARQTTAEPTAEGLYNWNS